MTVAQTLQKQFSSKLELGFLCNERTADLVSLNPSIQHRHIFCRDELRARARKGLLAPWRYWADLCHEIRAVGYDTAFDLSLGREFPLLGLLAGIHNRFGLDYRGRGFFLSKKIKLRSYEDRHVIDTQLKLLVFAGFASSVEVARPELCVSEETRRWTEAFLVSEAGHAKSGFLVVAPGGGRSWGENAAYKQWDPDSFSECIREIARDTSLPSRVLLLGDVTEHALLERVAHRAGACCRVVVNEPIEHVIGLLRKASLFIGNDGGLLHLANFLGIPVVGLYGPVDENVYGPYWNEAPAVVLTSRIKCRPCYKAFHFAPCPNERACLRSITALEVVESAKKILRR